MRMKHNFGETSDSKKEVEYPPANRLKVNAYLCFRPMQKKYLNQKHKLSTEIRLSLCSSQSSHNNLEFYIYFNRSIFLCSCMMAKFQGCNPKQKHFCYNQFNCFVKFSTLATIFLQGPPDPTSSSSLAKFTIYQLTSAATLMPIPPQAAAKKV